MATRKNQPEPLVKLVIPAKLITKESDTKGATDMRWMLDRAFRVCLGRCTWTSPVIITASVEQWGIFAYLLTEKGRQNLLPEIEVTMFIPLPPAEQPSIIDAHQQGSKVLHLPKMQVPDPTPVEAS